MNGENKISVVINTYNAERDLEQVLEAVKDFDEVLICDMESTDNTLDIARKHGCRIVTFPKADHKSAEPARTFAIQSAENPWVLVVDADEIVTPELRDYLYRRIAEADCPAGLYIPRWNRFMNRYTKSLSYDHQLRFFRREGTEWPPYVHTFPKVEGRTEKIPAELTTGGNVLVWRYPKPGRKISQLRSSRKEWTSTRYHLQILLPNSMSVHVLRETIR